MCKAFLVEAKWYSNGYTPTLEESLQISWISVGSLGLQTYVYCLLGQNLALEANDFSEKMSNILQLPGRIFRFADDLATSTVCKQSTATTKLIQYFRSLYNWLHWYAWIRVGLAMSPLIKDQDVSQKCSGEIWNKRRLFIYLFGEESSCGWDGFHSQCERKTSKYLIYNKNYRN